MFDWRQAVAAAKHWTSPIAVVAGVALIALFGIVLAQAGERAGEGEARTGTGVVCDTADQVQAVIVNKTIDVRQAIAEVNATIPGDDNACGYVTVAFIRGPKVAEVPVSAGIYDLTEITVIGAFHHGAWRVVTPTKQVTAMFRKAREI